MQRFSLVQVIFFSEIWILQSWCGQRDSVFHKDIHATHFDSNNVFVFHSWRRDIGGGVGESTHRGRGRGGPAHRGRGRREPQRGGGRAALLRPGARLARRLVLPHRPPEIRLQGTCRPGQFLCNTTPSPRDTPARDVSTRSVLVCTKENTAWRTVPQRYACKGHIDHAGQFLYSRNGIQRDALAAAVMGENMSGQKKSLWEVWGYVCWVECAECIKGNWSQEWFWNKGQAKIHITLFGFNSDFFAVSLSELFACLSWNPLVSSCCHLQQNEVKCNFVDINLSFSVPLTGEHMACREGPGRHE